MTSKQIFKTLLECKPILKKQYNVQKIGIFGSYALGKATQKSDIDILIKFSKPIGLQFVDLHNFLEKKTGKKVDLVTNRALKKAFKSAILKETKYL